MLSVRAALAAMAKRPKGVRRATSFAVSERGRGNPEDLQQRALSLDADERHPQERGERDRGNDVVLKKRAL